MDPYATLMELLRAIQERDTDALRQHADSLATWLESGGFAPDVTPATRALFKA